MQNVGARLTHGCFILEEAVCGYKDANNQALLATCTGYP